MLHMDFKYVRIQGKELAANTLYAKGIFSMCWQLIQQDKMDEEDEGLYREIDDWFSHPGHRKTNNNNIERNGC